MRRVKRKPWLLCRLLVLWLGLGLCLSGCGVPGGAQAAPPETAAASAVSPSPRPTPTPQPVPAPTPSPEPRELVIGGQSVSSHARELTLTDSAEAEAALEQLPYLETLDLTACPMTAAQIDSLAARYPDVKLVWTVAFGDWQVRSDISCFSTLFDNGHTVYGDETFAPLYRYCRDLVALDLGHMRLQDIGPLRELTKLQVLILADSYVADISPLSALTELRYLELFNCNYITDFTPLKALTKLEDLNISNMAGLKDLDFLAHMPALRCCWVRHSWLDAAVAEAARAAYPGVTLDFGGGAPTGGGWRATDSNRAVRTAFYYWRQVKEFRAWDDVEYQDGAQVPLMAPVQ